MSPPSRAKIAAEGHESRTQAASGGPGILRAGRRAGPARRGLLPPRARPHAGADHAPPASPARGRPRRGRRGGSLFVLARRPGLLRAPRGPGAAPHRAGPEGLRGPDQGPALERAGRGRPCPRPPERRGGRRAPAGAALPPARAGGPPGRPDLFTTAFFHRPEELAAELRAAELTLEGLYAIEGVGAMLPDFAARWKDPAHRETLLRFLRKVERESALLGASPHILAVARKPC